MSFSAGGNLVYFAKDYEEAGSYDITVPYGTLGRAWQYYDNGGNTLHNYGSARRIREATPDGEVVWDVSWDDGGTLGCTHPVPDLYALWHDTP